jgi:hypothetical protein
MPRLRLRALLLASLPLLAACEDAPTGPTSYAQVVYGATWVAVAEPRGLASAATWIADATPAAAAEARALRAAAARARSGGEIGEALELEDRAMRVVAGSLGRTPAPERVLVPLAALDAWGLRAEERLAASPHAGLAGARADVRAHAEGARAALAVGDTAAAVVHLAEGALAARAHGPTAVGARLLGALQERLDGAEAGASAGRARRLLAGAREGLATGDTVRALRRVIYAHQLLDAGIDAAAVETSAEHR